MDTAAQPAPPGVLSLLAHPLRWRLLGELASGDYRVRELTARVGRPQNLISYHLGRLRAAGLVAARRSSADTRELYYRAELTRCAGLLADVGLALHPGIRLQATSQPSWSGEASGRVLFLCTGNSSRSQMAEALTGRLTGGRVDARSAGSHPGRLHPNTLAVMRGYGIDLTGRRTKHMDEFSQDRFDYVVTLCDRVREVCPEFPGPAPHLHWSMANPAEAGESDEASYPAFERTAAELAERLPLFLELLGAGHKSGEPRPDEHER